MSVKRSKRRIWCFLAGVALLMLGTSAGAVVPRASGVTLADDAYHYRYYSDGRNDGNFIEWWYFNFFDEERGVQGIFTYFVADPQNRLGIGFSQVAAVLYSPEGSVAVVDQYPPGALSASYERADVAIESNSIQVIDPTTYRIQGITRDGKLKWDLTYKGETQPWYAGDRIPVGLFPWEVMSWLVYMPGADVSGRLEWAGRVYNIHSIGYHDHNWGEWIPTSALWNWAQYYEPGLAIDIGDFINSTRSGIVGLDLENEKVTFTKDQYQMTHARWAADSQGRQFPVETSLRAENQTRRLVMTLRTVATHPLRGDLPFPLPDLIIYEQTARYDGQIFSKGPDGTWVPLRSFSGPGFKEYTAVSY